MKISYTTHTVHTLTPQWNVVPD